MSEDMIVVNINTICRFCMEDKGVLSSVFDGAEEPTLVEQIASFSNIIVEPHEYLPPNVCHRCRTKIEQCFQFKQLCLHSLSLITDSVYVRTSNEEQSTSENNVKIKPLNNFIVLPLNTDNEKPLPNNDPTYQDVVCKTSEEGENIAEGTEIKKYVINSGDTVEINNEQNYATLTHQYPSVLEAYKKNQCLLCLEKLNDKDSLNDHINNHVEGTDLDPYYKLQDKNIYCKLCEKTFEHRFTFLTDQREHLSLKPYVCKYENCTAAFYCNAALRQHLPIHAVRKFICPTCGLRFKRKSDMKSHEIIHEDSDVDFQCSLCGLLCKNRLTYAAHVRKHQKPPRFKCDYCHKEYFSRSELSRHSNIHSTERKFKCQMCNSAYYSNSALNRHKKLHLLNDAEDGTTAANSQKSMKCHCGKKFFKKTLYNRHVANVCKIPIPKGNEK